MTTASPLSVSEPARERETFKYDDLGISTAALRHATPQLPCKSISTPVLPSTPDPCLTALAQLGLYRLEATHALISLFDRTYQHPVAEAIRCAPTCHDASPAPPEDREVYCGTTIPRVNSICEHVLTGPAELAAIPGTTHGFAPANLPVSVIPDLDLDPRFCHVRDKNRRFYVGVPIRAPTGVNIGVFCIMDNKPRPEGLSDDQVQFVRDISRTVMDYLEAKRSSEWYRRGERMVRGLGSFVEGQATLSNWSDSPNKSFFRDIPGVQEGVLNKKLQEAPGCSPGAEKPKDQSSKWGRSRPLLRAPPTLRDPASGPELREAERQPRRSSADQLQSDVERVFSKASNIIREAVEVEGVVFLDASVRSFGGLIGKEVTEPPILTRVPSCDSSSDESGPVPPSGADHDNCKVLGFSTSSNSSINGDRPPKNHADIPERLLRRLLQRYQHGHIFNFETDGSVVDQPSPDLDDASPMSPWVSQPGTYFGGSEDDIKSQETLQRIRRRRDIASSVQNMFPGAKSVAFVPLYDGQKNRWFAGGFVWTKTPTRIFTVENELSYLRVFGLTTMAEVSRLHTKAADKTKTDILGSISHELRSPLHGVVGAVDLLRNTMLDRAQENILRTIETSGRTLLDTIDHLLDYSRISNQIRAKVERRGSIVGRGPRNPSPQASATATGAPELNVHLDRLAEEVIESVLAGWSYRNRSDAHFAAWSTFIQGSPSPSSRIPTGPPSKRRQTQRHVSRYSQPVQVLLDIEPADWSFKTHPGAFRRIVMNLLGNSLKFTNTGFIRIKLSQEVDPESGGDNGALKTVILTVSDSGKGISQDYLRSQLFTPFSQEDPFAPGTGLGLSLVRQMAITLGGNIDVASRVGHGTTVTVSFPLPRGEGADEEEQEFQQNIKALRGSKVLLRGFDPRPQIREGFRRGDRKGKSQLQMVQEICRDWLHMDVYIEGDHRSPTQIDFVICSQSQDSITEGVNTEIFDACPHVVIRQDCIAGNHGPAKCCSRERFAYISQPIGPRKVADALVASRIRFHDSSPSVTADASIPPERYLNSPPLIPPNAEPFSPMIIEGAPNGVLPAAFQSSPFIPQPQVDSSVRQDDPEKPALLAGPSILIVDDNPINIKILTAYMVKLKHPYSTALNGLEAVEMYMKSPGDYRCILTDISMPVMDGLESTRRIREFERTNQLDPVTVITLTGLSGADIQQDAFVSGVDLFLTRPLGLKGLMKALESTGVMRFEGEGGGVAGGGSI